ncbi:MAG: hypothetical protein AB7H97_12595 [Pseudobdellovibrionaceae bacterium]
MIKRNGMILIAAFLLASCSHTDEKSVTREPQMDGSVCDSPSEGALCAGNPTVTTGYYSGPQTGECYPGVKYQLIERDGYAVLIRHFDRGSLKVLEFSQFGKKECQSQGGGERRCVTSLQLPNGYQKVTTGSDVTQTVTVENGLLTYGAFYQKNRRSQPQSLFNCAFTKAP